jgi:glycosyltransferase involved in cell wall biosynthesis
MSTPAVSVLMPAFNAERFIGASIRSVLAQDFEDFELLIVDDGSTDGTAQLVEDFHDKRIRILRNETNCGLVETLNKGLREARGTWVARQDADDLSRSDRIARQLSHFRENPDDIVVASEARLVDERDRGCGLLRLPRTRDQFRWDLCFRNPVPHSSVMMHRKKILDAFGGYPQSAASEDYALWSRVAATNCFGLIKRALVDYRIHSSSVMMSSGKGAADIARIRRENMERTIEERTTPDQIGLLAHSWERPAGLSWEDYVPAFESAAESFASRHSKLGSVPGIEYQTLIASGAPSANELLSALARHAPSRIPSVPWHRIAISGLMRKIS